MDEIYKKKYNEALERMKSWAKGEHPECFSEAQKAAEFVFPELKEGEDEKIRQNCIHFLKLQQTRYGDIKEIHECINWLENYKIPKLSEDDVRIKNEIIGFLERVFDSPICRNSVADYVGDDCEHMVINWITWLKKLQNTNIVPSDEVVHKNNGEWSDFDNYMNDGLINFLELHKTKETESRSPSMQDVITWLKSLKDRCILHPKSWKPTQVQLDCLKFCLECCNTDTALTRYSQFKIAFGVVESLYGQLKELFKL